jgi:mRNA interferase RelE/StbE
VSPFRAKTCSRFWKAAKFRETFAKDLKAIKQRDLLKRVKEAIEAIENASSLTDLPSLKKLKGSKNFFRQRVGDYRLGLALEQDTVVLVRFLNRKDIYKYFP